MRKANNIVQLSLTGITLSFFILWIILNNLLKEKYDLWNILELIALYLIYISIKRFPYKYTFLWLLTLRGIIEIAIVLLQFSGIMESNHSFFKITGTFHNPGPLGGFMAIIFLATVGLSLKYKQKKYFSICLLVLTICNGIVLILSDSRSGWLAAIIGALYLFWNKTQWNAWSRITKVASIFIILLFSTTLYFHKKDSADGRILIWKVTCHMIAEQPLSGHGNNSFSEKYMYHQARFFESHPSSKYMQYADSVSYPFNEMLHLWVENGLIAIILALWILYSLSYRAESEEDKTLIALLLAICTFSMTSYPSYIDEFKILFIFLLGLTKSKVYYSFKISVFHEKIFCVITFLLGIGLFSFKYYKKLEMESYLQMIYQTPSCDTGLDCNNYIKTNYHNLLNVPELFYLYAIYSCQYHKTPDNKIVLENAIQKVPSPILLCNFAALYKQEKNYNKAIQILRTAQYMLPYHIRPKYELFLLYRDIGKQDEAMRIIKDAMAIPIKTYNTSALKMRGEMNRYYNKFHH